MIQHTSGCAATATIHAESLIAEASNRQFDFR